jgi:hypothetical protein
MAIGETIGTEETLTTGASCDIKPTGSGDEWIVHNIYVVEGESVKVEKGNGTIWVHVDTVDSSMLGFYFHCTYTHYLRLTNMEATTTYVGYDGIQSK